MEREKQILQLLRDTRGVLSYQKSCSVSGYPRTSELESFLHGCKWQASPVPEASQEQPIVKSPQKSLVTKKGAGTKKNEQKNLAEIAAEVAECMGCSLFERRSCSVPGVGRGNKIRLLIIGHWLPVSEESTSVFGEEEDLMLERMLAAINLPMEEVFITNVIKCGVGPDIQPQAEHIDACLSYLRRQIVAVEPELICTMGMVATKTLLRLPQPLSRLRGRFYTYQGHDGVNIPLLPTYHPGYLLQNPEMKKATWLDLQALEKRILSLNKGQ